MRFILCLVVLANPWLLIFKGVREQLFGAKTDTRRLKRD